MGDDMKKGPPLRPLESARCPRQASFSTLPARMQEAHTRIRRFEPWIIARTDWRFGRNRRRCRLLAWLTVFPAWGDFPQM